MITLPVAELIEKLKGLAFSPDDVPVHSGNALLRVEFLQFSLEPFRAESIGSQSLKATVLAASLRLSSETAVMARQLVFFQVVNQTHIAVGTANRLPAGPA